MKILITGGGGFIGSSLMLALGERHDILSIDHGRNYPALEGRVPSRVSLIRGDVTDQALLDKLLPGVDVIVHLAGVAGERLCKDDPVKATFSNVTGTHILLAAARRHGVKKFIFGSSYWVYSFYDDRPMPLSETDDLRTDSFYGALKASSEREILDSASPYIIVRFATVYGYGSGVGAQWRGLVGKFIQAAFKGEPMTMYGDGGQGLDIVHIDDVVSVLTALAGSTQTRDVVLNVGSGRTHSIREIAETVKRLAATHFGKTALVTTLPAPPGKIWPDRRLAIDRIRRIVPDFPAVTLEEGILDMMKKYQAVRAA